MWNTAEYTYGAGHSWEPRVGVQKWGREGCLVKKKRMTIRPEELEIGSDGVMGTKRHSKQKGILHWKSNTERQNEKDLSSRSEYFARKKSLLCGR